MKTSKWDDEKKRHECAYCVGVSIENAESAYMRYLFDNGQDFKTRDMAETIVYMMDVFAATHGMEMELLFTCGFYKADSDCVHVYIPMMQFHELHETFFEEFDKQYGTKTVLMYNA